MRKNAALIGVLVLVIAAPLLAQPGQPAPDPVPADASPTAAGAKLSLAEMQAKIEDLDEKSEDDIRHVVRLQIVARKEKDVIRLNCINDKLLQMKALRNLVEAAKGDFEVAASASNPDEQRHEFTKITISAENIRVLREEANACAGEITPYAGKTIADWDGPDIPDDPSQDPFDDGIEQPGYASPFM